MKKAILILVAGMLLSGNAYAGWFDKLPVLGCKIGEENITYDLRTYEPIDTAPAYSKRIIFGVTDDEYKFYEYIDLGNGIERLYRYRVNRYTGIINLNVSPKYVSGQAGAFAKSFNTEFSFNGICKGAK